MRKVTLKDIGLVFSGGTPKTAVSRYWDGDVVWVTPKDLSLTETVCINDSARKITKLGLKESSAQLIPARSVVLSSRAPIGYVAVVDVDYATNQGCKSIKLVDSICNKYVYYYLKLQTKELNKRGSGTTFLELSKTAFSDFEIPICPLFEQKRIVAKIESLFSRLDSTKDSLLRVRAEIKRYRQAVLKWAFEGKLTTDRVEFKNKKVKDISEKIQYGYTASAKTINGSIRFLRITDIQNGEVNWGLVPFCDIGKDKIEKYRLFSNDIVFARTGATVGKTFLIKGEIPKSVFASYLIRVKLKEMFLPKYVYLYFQSSSYWRQITDGQVGIGQPNVNGTILGRLEIPVCILKDQIIIVQVIESRFERTKVLEDAVGQGLERIERLKQSILKKAFEGKLVEPDPNDEPVEVLLERIKKEKAKMELEIKPKRAGSKRRIIAKDV